LVLPPARLPRHLLAAALIATFVAALAGCGGGDGDGDTASGLRHTSFRVRADVAASLDADTGWAAAEGEAATVAADRPFRLRVELEGIDAAEAGNAVPLRLQVRRNGGPWTPVPAADHPYPDEIASPRVSVVEAPSYADGAPTGDLLTGSGLPFRPGSGVSLDSVAEPWRPDGAHGEWAWPLVIRRFADGAVTNDEGDAFTFRMADARGRPVPGEPLPEVTLTVSPGHLGGTFVETPGRLGPWQAADGALYFVMEPAETDNVLMVVRSTDGGRSWVEVDGANRPVADDLEGFATAVHGGRIHMLHQTSDAVWYHAFATSDAGGSAGGAGGAGEAAGAAAGAAEGPGGMAGEDAAGGAAAGPDGWVVRDEEVARPGEPPVQVAALASRSDGTLVAVYGDPAGLRYRIRSAGGDWGPETRVREEGRILSGPQVSVDPDDAVLLAYTARDGAGGRAQVRHIAPDGSLGPAREVDDELAAGEEHSGAIAPLARLPATGEVVIPYRRADGSLWERRVAPDGSLTAPVRIAGGPVAQNAVDSDQVGADAVGVDGEAHVLFIDETTGSILHARSGPGGGWSEPTPVVEGVTAQWVRGAVVERSDGMRVYGFVYDAGSDGGSGMNRYAEVELGGG
jgi:hypothetical protein